MSDIPTNTVAVITVAEYDELQRLRVRTTYLESSLQEIAKAKGAFSRDPLEHAGNCIDHMVKVANTALAGTWEEDKDEH